MDTSRPVTVVSASTGSIREVEVSPVDSTTTERTWTRLVAIRVTRPDGAKVLGGRAR